MIWSEEARRDYLEILRFIAAEDADAAERVLLAIEKTGENLATFATGHPGRFNGTYEKSVPRLPFIIAYAFADDDRAVSILRVIHTSRDWNAERWPE